MSNVNTDEQIHKQKFLIDLWQTTGVVLYPTRAAVTREIDGVELKNGMNQVIITNLTSLADPDSIRVSGTIHGAPARINDLTIDLVPNNFSSEGDLDDDDDDEEEDEVAEPQSLIDAKSNVDSLNEQQAQSNEVLSRTEKALATLEDYVHNMSTLEGAVVSPQVMKDTLDLHNRQRTLYFEEITETGKLIREREKDIVKAVKVWNRELRLFARSNRQVELDRQKKRLERAERQREKAESNVPSLSHVYRVAITLEATSDDVEGKATASLTLKYASSSASWTPHYDLRLDTINPGLSTLTYRAHFTNQTHETWTSVPITLSTSQSSFGGLNEKIPSLEKWRVTLTRKNYGTQGENGLYSLAEIQAKQAEKEKFFDDGVYRNDRRRERSASQNAKPFLAKSSFGGAPPPPPGAPLPRAITSAKKAKKVSLMKVSSSHAALSHSAPYMDKMDESGQYDSSGDEDEAAPPSALPGTESYGFTTTYELPTPRTVVSSPLVRRYVIAEIPLPSLVFSYIAVPKLQAAAFLKAKLTNTSNVPLLNGQAGLTLDGSFLGNLSFPRCSPSEKIELALGADQSVKVEYEKPSVKHATAGMILVGKEEVGAYRRSMKITNSKSAAVTLTIQDQVPVSEDEKLKVIITSPKGLREVNDVSKNVGINGSSGKTSTGPQSVAPLPPPPTSGNDSSFSLKKFGTISKRASNATIVTSTPAPVVVNPPTSTSISNGIWGKASASLKENGQIQWDVDLEKGGCVALAIEWECRVPSGDAVEALS